MASIGGVSSSNMTSSLYNSAHVVSGLASGLDTEGMIEGLVQSYQTKIQDLSNKATKLEWKQEAYRSIINKMYAFTNKYTSYSSATNLMSASFFNNAINVTTQGTNASKVTASGRTDSDVKLNKVTQLATAARYTTSSNLKGSNEEPTFAIESGTGVNFADKVLMGTLSGSLSLQYGGKTVSITFDANNDIIEDYEKDADGNYILDENGRKQARSIEAKAKDLADLINKKLEDSTITLSSGESKKATELIEVKAEDGVISFKDKSTGGNTVYMSGASGTVADTLGLSLDNASEDKPNELELTNGTMLTQTPTAAELVSKRTMNISLDGKSKTIYLPQVTYNEKDKTYTLTTPTAVKNKDGSTSYVYDPAKSETVSEDKYADKYAELLNSAVQEKFGNKITVANEGGKDLKLKIQAPKNSNLLINSDAGKALGIGNIATNYLNTNNTLGELLPEGTFKQNYDGEDLKQDFILNGVTIGSYDKNTKLSTVLSDINANSEAGVKVTYSQATRSFSFTSKEVGAESKVEMGSGLAEAMFGSTKVSDTSKGTFGEAYGASWLDGEEVTLQSDGFEAKFTVSKGDKIEDVANKLNQRIHNEGYTAAYNQYTGQLEITDKSGAKVDFSMQYVDKDLGKPRELTFNKTYAPDVSYTPGQDAKFEVEVNGQTLEMTRSSNNVNIDGMTINFKGTFETKDGEDPVTFSRSTDSDKIVDAVKSMVADFNEMLSEVRTQYATLPYQNSSGAFQSYDPLTDEERATMSESAIQNYEAKAKQGILFNDQNLSALYDKLRSIFSPGGAQEAQLQQMGLSLSYSASDNSASIVLDESKLRSMLDSDPDAVADMFTRSAASGGGSDGIMQQLKTQLDRYGSTTGAVKGILVEQAGTPLSSLTLMNNAWQKQIDSIGNDITKWQDKLTAQVDRYTSMFSKLEVLINQMNSQSSTLAGMMGG